MAVASRPCARKTWLPGGWQPRHEHIIANGSYKVIYESPVFCKNISTGAAPQPSIDTREGEEMIRKPTPRQTRKTAAKKPQVKKVTATAAETQVPDHAKLSVLDGPMKSAIREALMKRSR